MKKEISEKTFELNITSELLNFSKNSVWYLRYLFIRHKLEKNAWKDFMNQPVLFGEGLTQKEEADEGYDVSINYLDSNNNGCRLMFLQYKSGLKKNYSTNKQSKFSRGSKSSKHIMFTFNDDTDKSQHTKLRKLTEKLRDEKKSTPVFYVFPRITEIKEFYNNIGALINNSSFVSVSELDKQAEANGIAIKEGTIHKYRTSYDGNTSEVNKLFFSFEYNSNIVVELLSELICIQIERFAKILKKQNYNLLTEFIDFFAKDFEHLGFSTYTENELKFFSKEEIGSLIQHIKNYTNEMKSGKIPEAPSKFTTIVPKEGLKLKFDGKNDFSEISYQLF